VEPNKCCALKIGSGVCDSFPGAVHHKRFDTVLYMDAMIKAKNLWNQVVNADFFFLQYIAVRYEKTQFKCFLKDHSRV